MKEFGPVNQDRLTSQSDNPKLERRGDIFMPEGTVNGPEQSQSPQPSLSERGGKVNPRRIDPEKAARAQELFASLNRPGENASLAERRSFEMAQRAILENFGIAPIMGGSDDEPVNPDKQSENFEDQQVDQQETQGRRLNLEESRELLSKLGISTDKLNEETITNLASVFASQANSTDQAPERGFGFYLQAEDMKMLKDKDNGPLRWLETQFDTIYKVAGEGQELSSPVVSNIQTVVSEAIRFLQYSQKEHPEVIESFISGFSTRLNLIFMRSAIDHRSMDSAKEMSERLQAHGLLVALSMENGNVHRMFSRMGELLEDKRLADGGEEFHVSAEMMSRLQDDLIVEQLELAKKGIGDYGETYNKEKTGGKNDTEAVGIVESQIRRAVRTAYDALVVSQRQAVIVARGHYLPMGNNFLSDPSGLFNMYNYEDLLTGKFHIFNEPAEKFLKELKLDMAKSKLGEEAIGMDEKALLDYGTRMFRDLFAVADFFSSGWRVSGILKSVESRLDAEGKQDSVKDFGLFLRLKSAGKLEKIREGEGQFEKDKRKETEEKLQSSWGKIAEIRPEEIARLYRERAGGNAELESQLKKFFEGNAFNGFRVDDKNGNFDAFKTYDKFKKEFGPLIQTLRQQGYKEFRALKIGSEDFEFTPNEKAIVAKYFGGDESKSGQIKAMFAELSLAANNSDVMEQLIKHDKFEDIYTRTLLVDDALLDKLESPPKGKGRGITPLSRYWSSEIGGDALVRNYKDTEHAAKAAGSLLKFIYTEDGKQKIEAAEAFAESTTQYNGQQARADCIRYTIGSFLNMSKQDFMWDTLGIAKLPFRKAMSKIEKIYGPQAVPMSRDQLRGQLDKIHSLLIGSYDTREKDPEKLAGFKRDANKMYVELEKLLEVTAKDVVKRRAVGFLYFLIFATLLETYHVVDINPKNIK